MIYLIPAVLLGLAAVWLAWEMHTAPLYPTDPEPATQFIVCPKCRRTVELGLTPVSTPDDLGLLKCHWCATPIRIHEAPQGH